jgi:hypothetical protein
MFSLDDHIIPPNWLIYIFEDIHNDMCLLGVHLNHKPRCIPLIQRYPIKKSTLEVAYVVGYAT